MAEVTGKSKGYVVESLQKLYSVSRPTIFNRLKCLGFRIHKINDVYVVTEGQVRHLDGLHEWLNNGGKLADYPRPGELATIADKELEQYADTVNFEDLEGDDELSHAELIRAAQAQAAGILIAQNLLTGEMLKNPSVLPDDLLKQIEQSKVAIAPKPRNPLAVAGEWLTKAKAYQSQQDLIQREQREQEALSQSGTNQAA